MTIAIPQRRILWPGLSPRLRRLCYQVMDIRNRTLVYGAPMKVRHAGMGVAAGNGLLNNLIAYWPGNEANGNALDAHTNALHLTDTNTVTSNPGLVYALARQYTAVNGERHVRPGDDALLSTGDIDFTLAGWLRFDTLAGTLASKYDAAANSEYGIYYGAFVANRFTFTVRDAANTVSTSRAATTFGLPVVTTWYLIIGWHDSVANTLNIQVNNGAVDSQAYALGVCDSAATFRIGCFAAAGSALMNGRIGPTMFWKSAAGGGGVLTAAQRTALYNAGAGLTYAAFTL